MMIRENCNKDAKKPISIEHLLKECLEHEIKIGYDEVLACKGEPVSKVFEDIRKHINYENR